MSGFVEGIDSAHCAAMPGAIMKLPRRRFLHLAAGAVALPAVSRVAWAQAYPARPVHIVVGFPPGIGPDIIARLVGQRLSERFGQQFVIENRPGFSRHWVLNFSAFRYAQF